MSVFSPPNFVRYLADVVNAHDEAYPLLRWGQAYFNVLVDRAPNLAFTIRDSELDPFYDDSRIPQFIQYVQNHWGMHD